MRYVKKNKHQVCAKSVPTFLSQQSQASVKVRRHYRPCPVFSFISRVCVQLLYSFTLPFSYVSSAIISTGGQRHHVRYKGLDFCRPSYNIPKTRILLHTHRRPLHFVLPMRRVKGFWSVVGVSLAAADSACLSDGWRCKAVDCRVKWRYEPIHKSP